MTATFTFIVAFLRNFEYIVKRFRAGLAVSFDAARYGASKWAMARRVKNG
jgi:hypothetical protein